VSEALVLLHGFGGTRHSWTGLIASLDRKRYRPLALDLPGHGGAGARGGPITFESCVESILARSPRRFALCGYSLGGRVAMHVALAAPERVSQLVLVSTSAGIEDAVTREARRASDRRTADGLENFSLEQFIEAWGCLPLFREDPPEVVERAREDQRRNDRHGLASAMRGLGTGEMQPLWGRLQELTMPSAVVVGVRDAKFRALGERMASMLPSAEYVVSPGGHRLPHESPEALVAVLDSIVR
jgi:2-succinyl-6-hydroxy-2,4-cyclohexadiene-1-carboxylate synthase